MRISRTFNGTGAALYLGLGFKPDGLVIRNLEDGDLARLEWSANMSRFAETEEGILSVEASGDVQRTGLTYGLGVALYDGEDEMTAASTAYLVDLEKMDRKGEGAAGVITAWTLDTAANRTGSFDKALDTTHCGEGSVVMIKESVSGRIRTASISALSNDGDASDDVTLTLAIASGEVLYIGPMYDLSGAPAGTVIPQGIVINATSVINVSGEACVIEAWTNDG